MPSWISASRAFSRSPLARAAVDDAANVGDGALGLPGLRARRAAPLVEGEPRTLVQRFRMRLGQRDRAIEPVQRVAHREERLRALAGQDQVLERL